MARLPSIPLLPEFEWDKRAEQWTILTQKTRDIADSAGRSAEFDQLEDVIIHAVLNGQLDKLILILIKRKGVRALTYLWLKNDVVRERSLSSIIIAHIQNVHPKLGMSSLMNLISLFYQHFDGLEKSNFHQLADWLRQQINIRLKDREKSSDTILSALQENRDWLFEVSAPKALVTMAKTNYLDLKDQFKQLRLNELPHGRFLDICNGQYFLDTLREIPVGESHEVLHELLKSEVSQMPYESGKCIGHIALEIIIDRSDGVPGDIWQNFVLDIAGDPRIASTAKNYREWWKPIGEHRINTVTSWLAKEDLRLFLGAIEEYGKQSNDVALNRMFPARKRFLEGLYEHGLIRNTRLMLGYSAASMVNQILGKSLTTSYINLKGMNDKSIIYLDCGSFHLIEGSHEFKLWLYMGLPSQKLKDYSLRELNHLDLTTSFVRDFKKANGTAQYKDITHSPTTWQRNAIEFLAENGVKLDLEKVLSKEDYQYYIRRFGLPVVNKPFISQQDPIDESYKADNEEDSGSDTASEVNCALTSFLPLNSSLSGEAKRIFLKIEELGSCNIYILRTSLDMPANYVLNYIRGELAPYIEKDLKQMYRIKKPKDKD